MKLVNLPTRQPVPFATSGTRNTIPATQPVGSPGRASYSGGFPNETMQPIAAGGTPPFGQDFNGLFFDVTNELRWAQAGGTYTYDSAFSTAIGGYPAGAVLKSTLANVLWISTVDDNTTDPDGGSASGWVAFRPNSGQASLAVVAGDLTPTAAQKLCQVLSVTGNATGLTTTLRLPLTAGASYLINNVTTGSGATLNVQGATGTGVSVGQGSSVVVFTDGTNYYAAGISGGPYLPASGTAVAATKLATARAFNLAGVVTSDFPTFDGTANVTLNTSIADGALSIAKTNGLQTALDGKLSTGGGALTGSLGTVGVTFGSTVASSQTDLTKHISLYSTTYGINVTSGTINYVTSSGQHKFWGGASAGTLMLSVDGNGKLSVPNLGGGLFVAGASGGDAITLGADRLGATNMYGFGNEANYTYSKAPAGHRWYIAANSDNGASSRMTLTASGLTVLGTGNFTGSDRRLKKDIKEFKPRPLHRTVRLHSYRLKDTNASMKGCIAQDLLAAEPDYTGVVEGTDILTANNAALAQEIAMWAANEVDRIRTRSRWAIALLALAALVMKVL
jgi:hypothetical protein